MQEKRWMGEYIPMYHAASSLRDYDHHQPLDLPRSAANIDLFRVEGNIYSNRRVFWGFFFFFSKMIFVFHFHFALPSVKEWSARSSAASLSTQTLACPLSLSITNRGLAFFHFILKTKKNKQAVGSFV